MSSSLTAHFEVFWMGEQKLNKSRGKANKSHGNWIWRIGNEGQLINGMATRLYIYIYYMSRFILTDK